MKSANFLLLFISIFFQAQAGTEGLGIASYLCVGKIIKHTKNFQPAIPALSTGIEVNLLKQTDGKKLWQQLHHYPQIGLAFSFIHFGDDEILGNAAGVCPNIYLPLKKADTYSVNLRLGIGVAWLNKPYHVIDNPANNVIGSKLNNITAIGIYSDRRVNDKFSLLASVSWTHFSNGHFQSPNLGINFASFNFGIRYFPKPVTDFIRHDSFPSFTKRIKFNIKLGMGLSDRSVPNGPKYPIYVVSAYLTKLTGLKNQICFGVDAEYNKGVYDFELIHENFVGKQQWYAMRIAPFLADELILGQIGIAGEIGVYVHNRFLKQAPFYSKLSMKHYVFSFYKSRINFFYGLSMKAHYAKAEFFELGTGINF